MSKRIKRVKQSTTPSQRIDYAMVIKRVRVEDLEALIVISVEHELADIRVDSSVDGELETEETVDEGDAERGRSIHNTHDIVG